MEGASLLSRWESFYVIVGSAAAALTGLQFVVIALIRDVQFEASEQSISAFGTPNIVHFSAALFVASALSAPWLSLSRPAFVVAAFSAVGLVYVLVVIRRARRQSSYKPVLEDWIWHAVLPFVSYALFLGAACLLPTHPHPACFAIGAATLLLLFIGIHNAWDTVTYIALSAAEQRASRDRGDQHNQGPSS